MEIGRCEHPCLAQEVRERVQVREYFSDIGKGSAGREESEPDAGDAGVQCWLPGCHCWAAGVSWHLGSLPAGADLSRLVHYFSVMFGDSCLINVSTVYTSWVVL